MITGEVQAWHHSRKGSIRGVVIWEDHEWMQIKLVGNQELRYRGGQELRTASDGEVLTVRKSHCMERQA